jgi:hypothetical protein
MGWAASTKENAILSAFQSRISADGGSVEDVPCLSLDLDLLLSESSSFTTGLLEFYPGAAAAYSLRQLRRSVSPYAIRVRRANDDELDIGFGSDGELDTNALLDFADGGDAWVDTWYDQSSNGNDATQGTPDAQPQIVSSGSIIEEGGKPALEFDGTSQRLTNANEIMTGSSLCLIGVMKSDAASGLRMWVDQSGSNGGALYQNTNYQAFASFGGTYVGLANISTAATTYALFFSNWVSGNSQAHINGTQVDTNSASFSGSGNTGVPFWIGNDSQATTRAADGKLQEVIVYNTDQSTNRTGIETNINDYYKIY